MDNKKFIVDEKKCIHCGLCVKDCIEYAIRFDKNRIPKMVSPDMCINCRHCFSICPEGAISFNGETSSNAEAINAHNPDEILNLIKSRRSNRRYKTENVDKETVSKLKNMLKWVPTGCNFHALQFTFIEDIEVMNDFRNTVNEKLKKESANNPEITAEFGAFKDILLKGEDIIFRGAPHLIAVSNNKNAPCRQEDGIIALSYFELYAQSLGLGTCWCGFMKTIINTFPELCSYLEIPKENEFCYAMLFGNKAVDYARTIIPSDVNILSINRHDK